MSDPIQEDEDLAVDAESLGGEVSFDVAEDERGRRLDALVSERVATARAQVRRWIDDGLVEVNERPARASRKVSPGDRVTARIPETPPSGVFPEPIDLDILFEDDSLIVINKPTGMVVHPAPGHATGTLVNALLHHCAELAQVDDPLRPGIVHRLDRGTSGVMVAAKTIAVHQHLSEQFHDHTIDRIYWAFVRALPSAESGEVDAPIGRHARDRKRMSVRTENGRPARTRWRIAARFPSSGICKVEVHPETGRTHQIRVHLSSQGMPIAGDPVYGRQRKEKRGRGVKVEFARPALHAMRLGFTHPVTGERLDYTTPLAPDLADFERALLERDPIEDASESDA
jgi:23S rRNA pseudouridine1911/1915/1917 synthase